MISSMTGFGSRTGNIPAGDAFGLSWAWEIKGVNGKGFDVKFRLPPGFEQLEQKLRQKLAAKVGRGSLYINLQTTRDTSVSNLTLDHPTLEAVLIAAKEIEQISGRVPATVDEILNIRGVLISSEKEPSEDEQAIVQKTLIEGFEHALSAFVSNRQDEGHQLAQILNAQIDEIETLAQNARVMATTILPDHFKQLSTKIRGLIADAMPEERVEQEAALLAVKSDIREELDRLDGHVEAARAHLKEGGVVGRKLDFLAQEFGREANTLTSKAPSLEMKRLGLDLKLVVDQFREQVQNIE